MRFEKASVTRFRHGSRSVEGLVLALVKYKFAPCPHRASQFWGSLALRLVGRLGHIYKHEVKKSLSHDQHWAFIQGLSGIWPDDNQGSEVGNADPGSCFHQ